MGDPSALRRTGFRALFLGVAAIVVFFRILPVHVARDGLPAPDLLLLLIFAWVLRRPGDLPVWLVGAVALFADAVYMRPLGLWALLAVIGAEALRRRSRLTAEQPFPVEWMRVAGVLLAMTVARTLILAVTLVPQPPLGAVALEYAVTVAAYPLVVLGCTLCLGVRAPDAAHRDAGWRS